jgi:proline iminopeptidase
MSVQEGYVTTDDGVRLFFQKVGSGAQTVLLPNAIYLIEEFSRLVENRTYVFFDVRNRGRSDAVTDPSKLERGVLNDVDDIDAVRRYFGAARVAVIGHSYVGLIVALYAMKYPAQSDRVVQIGPMQPYAGKQYPPHLSCLDDTFRATMAGLAELEKIRQSTDPIEFCRKFWTVLAPLYVTDPADVGRIAAWVRCDLPNERGLMKYLMATVMPSIQRLNLTKEDLSKIRTPVLTVHGTKDRSAPYGGGREWALELPNARLVSVEGAGHGPWIESPAKVLGAIEKFLSGDWPEAAETVAEL